jgi:hypothetical protein
MVDWLLVGEDESDALKIAVLVDRVLAAHVEWLDEALLPSVRRYRGIDETRRAEHRCGDTDEPLSFTKWTDLKDRVVPKLLRPGLGGHGVAALKAIVCAREECSPPADAVILVRDSDGRPEVAAEMDAARLRVPDAVVCIAVPHPEVEAWQLHGFEPADAEETTRLESEKRTLGFDPRTDGHRLNPGREHRPEDGRPVKTSTKRVLKALTGDSEQRQLGCLRAAPLDRLEQRGASTGLADFTVEVRARLAPQLAAPRRPRRRPPSP